jgi:formate hydrogenlyase subunit 3/multisubunit Na+/H+ antiporter MnhD subunit
MEAAIQPTVAGATLAVLALAGAALAAAMACRAAVARRPLREIISSSAWGQCAFVVVALGIGWGTRLGYQAAFLHLLMTALVTAMMLLAAARTSRLGWIAMAVGAAAWVGLPPTGGFASKVLLYRVCLGAGSFGYVLGAISLAVNLLFLVSYVWHASLLAESTPKSPLPGGQGTVIAFLMVAILFMGFWPGAGISLIAPLVRR